MHIVYSEKWWIWAWLALSIRTRRFVSDRDHYMVKRLILVRCCYTNAQVHAIALQQESLLTSTIINDDDVWSWYCTTFCLYEEHLTRTSQKHYSLDIIAQSSVTMVTPVTFCRRSHYISAREENPLKGVSCQVDQENVVELEGVSPHQAATIRKQGVQVLSEAASCWPDRNGWCRVWVH